jgi:exopolysaccharide production protein ExoQ
MLHAEREGAAGAARVGGRGVALFIAAVASVILVPLFWAESSASLIGVAVVLLAILVLAVSFLKVAYREPIKHATDSLVGAEPRNLPLGSFERFFAVSVLFYSTGAFWRVLQGSRDTESGAWTGALMTNLLWVIVYLTALWLLRRCVVPWHLWKKGLVLLLPVPVAVVSLLWSQDRGLTFLRCGALIGTTVVALYFAVRFTIRQLAHFLAYALGLAAISSIVAAVCVPRFGIGAGEFQGIWLGAFAQKNELGGEMAVGFLVYMLLLWHERSHRLIWFSLAALSLFLVLKADSMTSFAICCVLPYLLWISKKTLTKKCRVITRIVYFGLPVLIVAAGMVLEFDRVTEALGRGGDLTGRTVLWAAVAPAILDRPYLGYGYEAFWRGYEGAAGEIWAGLGNYYYYSHNGFLEVLLGLGLVGLVSVLTALVFYSVSAFHAVQRQEKDGIAAFWPWAFLMYLLLSNLLEGNLMKSNNLPWLLYMITALSLCFNQVRGVAFLGRHEDANAVNKLSRFLDGQSTGAVGDVPA